MTDLAFDDLRWLHLLWAVFAVAALGALGLWQRQRALRQFATTGLLGRLVPGSAIARGVIKLLLIVVALTLLVAALIGPRWGQSTQQLIRRNIDVMILLDVSRSMLAEDIAPNRLERAKLAIRDDLLPALGGDRIGLVTFAGVPSVACPLTSDYGFFRLALDDVTVRSAPRGGTLIGDAIRKAADVFADDKLESHKLIVLITDGEDHESYPVQAAAGIWEDLRVPVVALALGDPVQGARIPARDQQDLAYLTHEGQTVWTKADFTTLEQVAEVSDQGVFVPVGTSNFHLGKIYQSVARAIRYEEETEQQRVTQPARFHRFAVVALLLVLIDSFVRSGPRHVASVAARRADAQDRAA